MTGQHHSDPSRQRERANTVCAVGARERSVLRACAEEGASAGPVGPFSTFPAENAPVFLHTQTLRRAESDAPQSAPLMPKGVHRHARILKRPAGERQTAFERICHCPRVKGCRHVDFTARSVRAGKPGQPGNGGGGETFTPKELAGSGRVSPSTPLSLVSAAVGSPERCFSRRGARQPLP